MVYKFAALRRSDHHIVKAQMLLKERQPLFQLESWCAWLPQKLFTAVYEIPAEYERLAFRYMRELSELPQPTED